MIGQRFSRLVVLALIREPRKRLCYRVRCDCGAIKIVIAGNVRSGLTRSCGCLQRERTACRTRRHEQSRHYLRTTWSGLKQRCRNPNHPAYRNYGGRGIVVCSAWQMSFVAFRDYVLAELGERPDGYTLDRINNDGPYAPGNVRWANRRTQYRNSRAQHDHLHTPAVRLEATISRLLSDAARGERHHQARLNDVAVGVIRFLAARGVSHSRLARAYGVEWSGVSAIVRRERWRHASDLTARQVA